MPTLTAAYATLAVQSPGGMVPLCDLWGEVKGSRESLHREVLDLVRSGSHRIDFLDHPGRLDGRGYYTAEERAAGITMNGETWFFLSKIGE